MLPRRGPGYLVAPARGLGGFSPPGQQTGPGPGPTGRIKADSD